MTGGSRRSRLEEAREPMLLTALGALQLLVALALGVPLLLRPRSAPPPAALVNGRLRLPLRQGYAARLGGMWVVLASLAITAAILDGRAAMVLVAIVAVAAAVVVAGWWVLRGAAQEQVVLDPRGLSVPAAGGRVARLRWTEVEDPRRVARPRQVLVVASRSGRPAVVRLLPQAWSAEALTELIEHYAAHPQDRHELVAPEALDRFRRPEGPEGPES